MLCLFLVVCLFFFPFFLYTHEPHPLNASTRCSCRGPHPTDLAPRPKDWLVLGPGDQLDQDPDVGGKHASRGQEQVPERVEAQELKVVGLAEPQALGGDPPEEHAPTLRLEGETRVGSEAGDEEGEEDDVPHEVLW